MKDWRQAAGSAGLLALLLLLGIPLCKGAAGVPIPGSRELLQENLELVLSGDYGEARISFEAESKRGPVDPLPHLGILLVDLLEMYERDDFSREEEFAHRTKTALSLARQAVRRHGRAWDHAMEGMAQGLMGLHEARKQHWLSALRHGFKAKHSLKKATHLDSELADAYLGLGIFHYYGSVLTKSYWFLPGFGDRRQQGLEEILRVQRESTYLSAVAEYTLLYVYYDQKRYRKALPIARELARRYPRSGLSLSWLGWVQRKVGDYSAAVATFGRVRDGGPRRFHCLYHLGTSRLFEGRDLRQSVADLRAFLATRPTNYWRARAYYRLGHAYLRLEEKKSARSAFQASAAIDPKYERPREQLAALKRAEQRNSERPPSAPPVKISGP